MSLVSVAVNKKRKQYSEHDFSSYDQLKEEARKEITKALEDTAKNYILKMIEQLEIANYPIEEIASKINKDIGDLVGKSWMYEVISDKYKSEIYTHDVENELEREHRQIRILQDAADIALNMGDICDRLVKTLKSNPTILEVFINQPEINKTLDELEKECADARPKLEEAKKNIDMREWVGAVQEVVMRIANQKKALRYISHIFAISAKWAGKEIKKNITKLEAVIIDVECQHCKQNNKVDLLPFAVPKDRIDALTQGKEIDDPDDNISD